MQFTSSNDTKEFENPSVGSHNATLIQVIDLGTQVQIWEVEEKRANKVLLVWELDEKMKDGKPFVAHREFTTSLHEKASLRTFLEGWRGRKFTSDEIRVFTLEKMLNASALLSLVMSKNGKYVNVSSASKLMAGMPKIVPVNPVFYFDMENYDAEVFNKIWPWVQKKIQASPQYGAIVNPPAPQANSSYSNYSYAPGEDDSNIPF